MNWQLVQGGEIYTDDCGGTRSAVRTLPVGAAPPVQYKEKKMCRTPAKMSNKPLRIMKNKTDGLKNLKKRRLFVHLTLL